MQTAQEYITAQGLCRVVANGENPEGRGDRPLRKRRADDLYALRICCCRGNHGTTPHEFPMQLQYTFLGERSTMFIGFATFANCFNEYPTNSDTFAYSVGAFEFWGRIKPPVAINHEKYRTEQQNEW